MALRDSFRYLNQYDLHKKIINDYLLRRPGDTKQFQRDASKDKRDIDVIRENHRFLWEETDEALTWEQQFARKYYDRLFKEYCVCDLSRYKDNQIAMRWRIEKEVVTGKGQFICANKICAEENKLRTWEVNFAYREHDERKNALVKIRLCGDCSAKLNYHSTKREVRRKTRRIKRDGNPNNQEASSSKKRTKCSEELSDDDASPIKQCKNDVEDTIGDPWANQKTVEQKSRDEEMEEYLDDLLL